MPRRALLVILGLAAVPVAAPAPANAMAVRDCAGVNVGHTTASVSVRNTTCRRGRRVVRRWVGKDFGDNGPPRISYVGYWHCSFTGRNDTLTLRCIRGRRVVRAVWGD